MSKPTRPENRPAGRRFHDPGTADAETLAIEALRFIAADTECLDRFLALSGLRPDSLRNAATQPGFFTGVTDHLMQDESLLLAFATASRRDPREVAACHDILLRSGK